MSGLKIFCLVAPNGKSAYLDVVNGKLVHGGDLPTDEAAEIFMKEMAKSLQKLQERQVLQKQRDDLLAELKRMVDVFGRDGHDTEYEEGECIDIDIARGVIARAESGNDGWISVLDRLPEKAGLYAVYLARTEYGGINKDGSVGKVEYDWWRSHHWEPESAWGYWELGEEDWQWSTTKNPDRIGTIITHWQPAPQPPVNAPKAPLTDAERDKIIAALKAARNRSEK